MGKPQRGVDLMAQAAEALIIKGKDQGHLSPDDILVGLAGTQLDAEELIQVVAVFEQMGIPIADGDKDLPGAELDDDLMAETTEMDSAAIDDPIRM